MNEDDTVVTTTAPDAVTEVLDTPAPQEAKKKVQFSGEQQAKLEQLIRSAKSEAAKELRREHAKVLAENESLRASLHLPQETQAQLEATNAKLAEAQAEYTRVSNLTKSAAKREALQSAAQAANFFDSSVGAKLLEDEVVYQDDALVVVGKDGEPRLNQYGENFSVAELARERAAQMPWAVKSTLRPGVGSTTAAGHAPAETHSLEDFYGPKATLGHTLHTLSKTNPRKYAELRRAAVEKGLLFR